MNTQQTATSAPNNEVIDWQTATRLHEGDRVADIFADTMGTFVRYVAEGSDNVIVKWDEPHPLDEFAGCLDRSEVLLVQRAKGLTPTLPTLGQWAAAADQG